MKRFIFFLVLVLILPLILLAQTADPGTSINIPAGFNWLYLIFFAVGMLIHYAYKVYQTLGTANFAKNLFGNLIGWFVNKFHWTLIAGGAAAVIGVAVQYGLPAEFASLNVIGVGIAIVAGYIGDIANQGTLK